MTDNNDQSLSVTATPLSNKIYILSQLLGMVEDNPNHRDFFEYYTLPLYLAYSLKADLVSDITERGERQIDLLWQAFLVLLNISDTGFANIDDMLQDRELVL